MPDITIDWIFQQLSLPSPEPVICEGSASRLRSLRTTLYKVAREKRLLSEPCPPFTVTFATSGSPDSSMNYREFARLPGATPCIMTIHAGSTALSGISIRSGLAVAPVGGGNADDFLDAVGALGNTPTT